MQVALTREVSPTIGQCELTHLSRSAIDVAVARAQHAKYESCLAALGCKVHRLPPAPELPDAVFVEDCCVVVDELAVIARPGSAARRTETASVAAIMATYRKLHFIEPPGTLDGGDVLRLGDRVFVGLSSRTNLTGIRQLEAFLAPSGYSVTAVNLKSCLHLKSAVTQVEARTLLVNRSWVEPSVFDGFATIDIDPAEPFAANALMVSDCVVYPSAYTRTRRRLEEQGIQVEAIDASELAKAEGGVTCCSVLFKVG